MQKDETTQFLQSACADLMDVAGSLGRASLEQQASDVRNIAKNGEVLAENIERDGLNPANLRRFREWADDAVQESYSINEPGLHERVRVAGETVLEVLASHEAESARP